MDCPVFPRLSRWHYEAAVHSAAFKNQLPRMLVRSGAQSARLLVSSGIAEVELIIFPESLVLHKALLSTPIRRGAANGDTFVQSKDGIVVSLTGSLSGDLIFYGVFSLTVVSLEQLQISKIMNISAHFRSLVIWFKRFFVMTV